MKKFHLIILFLLLVFCSRQEKIDEHNQLLFNIDSSKIQKPFVFQDIGIQLSAPIKWIRLEKSAIEWTASKVNLNKNDAFDTLEINGIFSDTLNSCYLIISKIKTNKNFSDFCNQYDSILSLTKESMFIRKGTFIKGKLSFMQLLIVTKNFVNFKLLSFIKNKNIFQIDYIIPNAIYSKEIAKAVESSIGTIELIP